MTATAATAPRVTSGFGAPVVRSGALMLVSVAAALTYTRVFDDSGFAGPAVLAAVVPHVIGLVARRRGWTVAAGCVAGAIATALALLEATAGDATTYGIPTPATFHRLGHLVDGGWSVFRTGIAPVPSRPGVVLLCAVTVAIVALTADAVARRPEVTMAALAPSLVLFVLTGTLGSSTLRVTTTIVYVAAALVDLVVANAWRLEQRRTWFTGRRLASEASLVRHAAAIGGVALIVGLVLTPLVPGVDGPALLHYRNGTGHGSGFGDYTGVSPLVDLRARLTQQPDTELFRVTSPVALAWRLIALDRFDGNTWSLTSSARDASQVLRATPGSRTVRQEYAITALSDRWIPAAYRPVETTIGNARAIPGSDTLVAPAPVAGLVYQVQSQIERPLSAQEVAETTGRVPESIRPFLALPHGFLTPRTQDVLTITASAATPYEKALALQQFFTDGRFVYDTSVALGDGQRAIDAFLTTRRGFCQQFAAAYAALARAAGIPSRVVVGFTPGRVDEATGEYVVRGRDAHAWTELWFSGLGWRTFDPTPAGPLPGQADARVGTHAGTESEGPGVETPSTTAPVTTVPPTGAPSVGAPIRDQNVVSTDAGGGTSLSARTVGALTLVGLALVAGLVLLVRRLTRARRVRRHRRGAVETRAQVTGAWLDVLDSCARAGLETSRTFTPAEQAERLERGGLPPEARDPLRDLVELYERSAYSAAPTEADVPTRAWRAADRVRSVVGRVRPSRRDASGRASAGPPSRRSRRPSPRATRT